MSKILYLEEIGGTILRRFPTSKKLLKDIMSDKPFDVLMVSLLLYSKRLTRIILKEAAS